MVIATKEQLENIGKKTTAVKRPGALSLATRASWASVWSARLTQMLETPPKHGAPGRIWRMRYFQDENYIVATLLQTLQPPATLGQQAASPKVKVFVSRGYHFSPSAAVMELNGQYSSDEIVAFLRLDLVQPDGVEAPHWQDETRYKTIELPTNELVAQIAQGVH